MECANTSTNLAENIFHKWFIWCRAFWSDEIKQILFAKLSCHIACIFSLINTTAIFGQSIILVLWDASWDANFAVASYKLWGFEDVFMPIEFLKDIKFTFGGNCIRAAEGNVIEDFNCNWVFDILILIVGFINFSLSTIAKLSCYFKQSWGWLCWDLSLRNLKLLQGWECCLCIHDCLEILVD